MATDSVARSGVLPPRMSSITTRKRSTAAWWRAIHRSRPPGPEDLGGEGGPFLGVVVTERRAGQRLPAVVAGQGGDPVPQLVEFKRLSDGEVDGGHVVEDVSRPGLARAR